MDIGLAGALIGGVLTLLSPCSVMLLPAFFSYAFGSPSKLLGRTALFYAGLIATLVPLGLLAGTFGSFVNDNRMLLVSIAAGVIIVLGIIQLVGIPLPSFVSSANEDGDGTSAVSVFLLGTVYGLAGVCAGPILGSVLSLAALGGSALYGGLVLMIFALGMTIPLFVLAFFWGKFVAVRQWMRPRTITIGPWTNSWTLIISGLLGIGIGVLLLVTEGTSSLGGILGATDQVAAESAVLRGTSDVPDILVIGIALAALAAVWGVRTVARRRSST